MERIVTNTGPLIALAGIECLDILDALFDEVFVPLPVHREIIQGTAYSRDITAYRQAKYLQILTPATQADPLLTSLLDQGEAAVIQLAQEKSIQRVLIDERKGRKVAREVYGLSVFGTARLLVEAKHAGLVENVREPLAEMRDRGYWIHDTIVQFALQEAGEV